MKQPQAPSGLTVGRTYSLNIQPYRNGDVTLTQQSDGTSSIQGAEVYVFGHPYGLVRNSLIWLTSLVVSLLALITLWILSTSWRQHTALIFSGIAVLFGLLSYGIVFYMSEFGPRIW